MTARLTSADLDAIVDVAERAVHLAVAERRVWVPDLTVHSTALRQPRAAFVTLHRSRQLRGCIGTLAATHPLVVTVADRARAAAFDDPRFPAVSFEELIDIEVSVSVLTPMEPLDVHSHDELLAAVRPGVDGLLIEVDRRRATLLPSVWDQIGDSEEFLETLWRKAALAPGSWTARTRVWRYTAEHATRVA